MDWKTWVAGLISAVIGGAATSVTAMVVAPESFNATGEGIRKVLIVAAVGAVLSAAAFLKQSPIPPPLPPPK